MKHIDIRRIDLNLLIAFEAIYQEGSVTGASERLYLTQSALSHALSRLRELCDDPLFERHGKIMVPTGMARQLIVPVQSALTLLERSLNQPYPAVSGKVRPRLTIGLISMYEAAFLPRLMARMAGEPDYEIAVTRYAPGKLEGHLAQGKFDVAIQMETPHSVHVRSTPLLRERLAVMARCGHPQAGEDIDLATYMAQYHVVVVPDERWTDFVSQEFQRLRLNRQVVLRCQDYWTAARTVATFRFPADGAAGRARAGPAILSRQPAAAHALGPRYAGGDGGAPRTGTRPGMRILQTAGCGSSCARFSANVVQARGFPARILAEVGLLEQHGGHRILEDARPRRRARARCRRNRPWAFAGSRGRCCGARLYREHDVERLQYVEVALQRGRGRSSAAAGVAPCCSHHSRTEMGCNLNSR